MHCEAAARIFITPKGRDTSGYLHLQSLVAVIYHSLAAPHLPTPKDWNPESRIILPGLQTINSDPHQRNALKQLTTKGTISTIYIMAESAGLNWKSGIQQGG